MRSRPERRIALLLTLLLTLLLGAPTADAAGAEPRTPLSSAEIDSAVARGRADPDIGSETKSKRLHWVGKDTSQQPPKKPDEPRPWLVHLFDFLGRSVTLIVWGVGFLAAGMAGVLLYRAAGARAPRVADLPPAPPSQIDDLGSRRASLPDDIGAAADRLLDAGQIRESLSLLYRGALARATRQHGILIGESATEGEVLRAVDGRLEAASIDYLRTLVQLWQRAVYAGSPTPAEVVRPLCAQFRKALG